MRDVAFDVANLYGNGTESSAAITTDDLVVEVHREQTNQLYQRFGRATGSYVQWGATRQYGTGTRPRIASSVGRIVEVHETTGGTLAYSVGAFANNDFSFRASRDYGAGKQPSVGINSDLYVVGIDRDDANALYYRVGAVAPDFTLAGWSERRALVDAGGTAAKGTLSAIAINRQGMVVAIFQELADPRQRTVDCRTVVGRLVDGQRIEWGAFQFYDQVLAPSIALTEDGTVIAASLATAALLVSCRTGTVDLNRKLIVNWSAPQNCNTISSTIDGTKSIANVSVSTNGRLALETFGTSKITLGYSGTLVADRSRWMQDNLPTLGGLTLKGLSVPGSHDASAYEIRDCSSLGARCNSQTQLIDYRGQLDAGVRYFDIRPVYYHQQLETGHFGNIRDAKDFGPLGGLITVIYLASISDTQGCGTAHFADILRQVREYMQTGVHELVILKFSHYYDRDRDVERFNAAVLTLFVNAVVAELGDYFFTDTFQGRLADLPLSTFIANRGVVLPLFDFSTADSIPLPRGVFRYRDFDPTQDRNAQLQASDLLVYDKFADTNSLTTLQTDQAAKLRNSDNHGGDLFLYSWTLTQSFRQQATCNDSQTVASNILTLSSIADGALAENITTLHSDQTINLFRFPNIIYVDQVRGFAGDTAIWLNQRTNAGDTLYAAQRGFLAPGDSLLSAGGRFRLFYDNNGDLMLFQVGGGLNRSVSNTAGKPAWRCVFGEEGSLIVYSSPYNAVFTSDTENKGAERLVLTNDGKIVLYDGAGKVVPSPKLG